LAVPALFGTFCLFFLTLDRVGEKDGSFGGIWRWFVEEKGLGSRKKNLYPAGFCWLQWVCVCVAGVLKNQMHCTHHAPFSKVWSLFLKECVKLLQEVFYPGSRLLADERVAGKGIPINGLYHTHMHLSGKSA
jgi:hypothetical protein